MRVSKKERKENARNFYNMFMNSNCNKAAIVVQRTESKTNPNINSWKDPAYVRLPYPTYIHSNNIEAII